MIAIKWWIDNSDVSISFPYFNHINLTALVQNLKKQMSGNKHIKGDHLRLVSVIFDVLLSACQYYKFMYSEALDITLSFLVSFIIPWLMRERKLLVALFNCERLPICDEEMWWGYLSDSSAFSLSISTKIAAHTVIRRTSIHVLPVN